MKDSPQPPTIESLLAHSNWMEGLALVIAGDPNRAADALQDTWVAVLEGRMHSAQAPESWLRTVLANFVRLGHRREASVGSREQYAARPEATDDSHSPSEIVERADLQRRVLEAIVALHEPYRSTLLMRYMDELSAQEIGQRLGLPSSTIRNRSKRALVLVRERLGIVKPTHFGASLLVLICAPLFKHTKGMLLMSTSTKVISAIGVLALAAGLLWKEPELEPTTLPTGIVGPQVVQASLPSVAPALPDQSLASPIQRTPMEAAITPAPEDAEPRPEPASSNPRSSFRRIIRVLDLDLKPVADAELSWMLEPTDTIRSMRTDLLGLAELELPEGTRRITAFAQDIGMAEQALKFSEDTHRQSADFHLLRPTQIHGVVLRADGRTAPGAVIETNVHSVSMGTGFIVPMKFVTADADGHFELLLDTRCTFILKAEYRGLPSISCRTQFHSYEQVVELTLLETFSIGGEVKLASGAAAVGARLEINEVTHDGDLEDSKTSFNRMNPEVAFDMRQALDADGIFSYALPRPGSYRVTIFTPETNPFERVLKVHEEAPHAELNVTLGQTLGITGQVSWEDGEPAGDCTVMAWPTGATDPTHFGCEPHHVWALGYAFGTTDVNGAFSLLIADDNREYTLGVRPSGEGPETLQRVHNVAPGPEPISIQLSDRSLDGSQVTGSIHANSATGAIVDPEYLLHYRDTPSDKLAFGFGPDWGKREWQPLIVEDGSFRIQHLIQGHQYGLYIRAQGLGTMMLTPWIAHEKEALRDIVLELPITLEINATRTDGTPAPRAAFQLIPLSILSPQPGNYGQVRADAGGKVICHDILSGRYYLSSNNGERKEIEIQASDGRVRESLIIEAR